MSEDSPFIMPSRGAARTETAESLFSLLARRDPNVQQLWSHQADALRAFHEVRENPDVAIELPTGSGKTLVALLVAEWTRRSTVARVLYLCADNALVAQVAKKAADYGIRTVSFTGPGRDYPAADLASFNSGEAVGISNYWTLFNSSPRLQPTHVIVDDAHSAGPAIASNSTVEVSRDEHPDAFKALFGAFQGWLPGDMKRAIAGGTWSSQVEWIPVPVVDEKWQVLCEVLDNQLPEHSPPWYSWSQVRDHQSALHLLASSQSFVLRPFIPPTHTVRPFREARQRIYLSATLGREGDLERAVGRRSITRVASSLNGSIGRRFVIFGDAGLDSEDEADLLQYLMSELDRSVVLSPSRHVADELEGRIRGAAPDLSIMRNDDIRESYSAFENSTRTALVLANRYDGIDLPGSICRLLILNGRPTSGDLMERYLWDQLGAHDALWERVITRIWFCQGSDHESPASVTLSPDLRERHALSALSLVEHWPPEAPDIPWLSDLRLS